MSHETAIYLVIASAAGICVWELVRRALAALRLRADIRAITAATIVQRQAEAQARDSGEGEAGTRLTLAVKWRWKEADGTPCHHCTEPTYGKMLRLHLNIGPTNRLTPMDICLCKPCGDCVLSQPTRQP